MSCVALKIKVLGKEVITEDHIRKGSCLINVVPVIQKGVNPYHSLCTKYFFANIKLSHHHTTVKEGYQAVAHIGCIRNTVEVVKIKGVEDCLRVGDTAKVLLKFKYGVELVEEDAAIMLREGSTRAVGFVDQVFPMSAAEEFIL